jgi:hypothetical protein
MELLKNNSILEIELSKENNSILKIELSEKKTKAIKLNVQICFSFHLFIELNATKS